MNLTTVLSDECAAMTDEEALAHVQAKTTITDGTADSGRVLAYIASVGKLNIIRTIADTAGHVLQDAADAAMVTIECGGSFDFRDPAVVNLFNAFVTATVLTADDVAAMRALGEVEAKAFPNIKMVNIVSNR